MDLSLLDRKLEKAFARSRTEKIAVGTLKWRRVPAPLWQYAEEVASEDDRDEVGHGSFEEWPGNVSALLEDRLVGVLGFYWDGFGPMSWAAGIQILDCGDHGWLCYWDEMSSYQAVARLEPWCSSEIISSAVAALLGETGRRQGLGFFSGSLPNGTYNRSPDLLPTSVVRQAYFDWLQCSDSWNELAEEHFGRIVEPNHLQRCLDILAGLLRLDDPDAVAAYLEDDDAPELDEKARRRLFEEWFESTYEVSAPRADTAGDLDFGEPDEAEPDPAEETSHRDPRHPYHTPSLPADDPIFSSDFLILSPIPLGRPRNFASQTPDEPSDSETDESSHDEDLFGRLPTPEEEAQYEGLVSTFVPSPRPAEPVQPGNSDDEERSNESSGVPEEASE